MNLRNYIKTYYNDKFFNEVFIDEIYKPVLEENCGIVLDIGACAGEFSFWIYDRAKQIYAIEPHLGHFAELVSNIRDLEANKVKPFNIALDDKNGEDFLVDGVRGGHTIGTSGQPIITKTLATFIKENNIDKVDILKIDVEGREDQIFQSKDFLEVADRIKFIIGEHLGGSNKLLLKLGFKSENCGSNVVYKRSFPKG